MKKASILSGIIFSLFLIGIVSAAKPVLFFSDLTSGPKIGLNDGKGSGAIVTIWGKNLGNSQGNSMVYFQDSLSVSRNTSYIYYWKNADGNLPGGPADLYTKMGMQEIAFSIPSGASDGLGKIYVIVNGNKSNELNFTVRDGHIYYVDINSPNNPGSGTFSNPWRSPSTVYTSLQPGDIVYFFGGLYNQIYGDPAGSGNLVFYNINGRSKTGTEQNPITYSSYPGELVTFSALGGSEPNSNFKTFSDPNPDSRCNWYTVSKFSLKAYYNCVIDAGTGWRVIGNDCQGMTGTSQWTASITTWGKSGKILGNLVHGGRTGSKMDHAIYPSGCPSNGGIDVGWNYIYDNNFANSAINEFGPLISVNHQDFTGDPSQNRCGSTEYVDDIFIHDNFVDCTNYPARGISIYDLSYRAGDPEIPSAYIFNNIFIKCGGGDEGTPAIIFENGKGYIYNNLFYDTRTRGIYVLRGVDSDTSRPVISVDIKNNIIYIQSSATDYISILSTGFQNVSNNLYYGNGNGPSSDKKAINANPLFLNPSAGDFHLQSNSPAIDNGTNDVSSIVKNDFDGNPRPQGSVYDIGAFEYLSGNNIPTITSAPQNMSHGQSITISGSGFGTKTTAAPLVWDNCSGTNILTLWDGYMIGATGYGGSGGNISNDLNYRTPSELGRGVSLPHSHISKYLCGSHYVNFVGDGSDIMPWIYNSNPGLDPVYVYASWYRRIDPNWNWGNGDKNFKDIAWSNTLEPTPYIGNRYISHYDSSLYAPYYTGRWASNQPWTEVIPGAEHERLETKWVKTEWEAKFSVNGYMKVWEDGVLKMHETGNTWLENGPRCIAIEGFFREVNSNNWRYFADIYLDYSIARILLCPNNNWTNRGNCEIQIPNAWNTNSITFTANQGSFANGTTAYLFVVDANGTASAGYPITISGQTQLPAPNVTTMQKLLNSFGSFKSGSSLSDYITKIKEFILG
jgi:hypothetical protein